MFVADIVKGVFVVCPGIAFPVEFRCSRIPLTVPNDLLFTGGWKGASSSSSSSSSSTLGPLLYTPRSSAAAASVTYSLLRLQASSRPTFSSDCVQVRLKRFKGSSNLIVAVSCCDLAVFQLLFVCSFRSQGHVQAASWPVNVLFSRTIILPNC